LAQKGSAAFVNLRLQASLLNVADINRSIEFYEQVLGFSVMVRNDPVAALEVNETEVLIVREVPGAHPPRIGRGYVGVRLLTFEAETPEDFQAVEKRLIDRDAVVTRTRTEEWEAVVGADPDGIEMVVSRSLSGKPMRSEQWQHLHDIVYNVSE
jgi:catechol-2,3-dioxygenase